jgi:Protein of unknown function (DUF2510)
MSDNPAGWQPDPAGKHDHRYWDGSQWTDNVSDAGVASTDPYEGAASEEVAPEAVAETPGPEAEPAGTGSDEPTVVTPIEDTTASYPTATTTPPVPPPYVPPSPVADGGGGGGSKRGLLIGGAILAAVAIAVIAFLALGGDDDPSVRAQLATAIEDDTDVTSDQAECIADLIVDEAGEDAFQDTDFDAEDPPPEFITAFLAVGPQAFADECGVDETAFGGSGGSTDTSDEGTDTSDEGTNGGEDDLEALEDACADGDFEACDDLYFAAEVGSDLEDFGSTCGGTAEPQQGSCEATNGGEDEITGGFSDGNFEDIIADTYQEAFGLSEEKAQCLAERISGAIEDGELNEEEAMSEIFEYLEECDISLEEIGAN